MNTGDLERLHEELVALLEGQLGPEDKDRVEAQIVSSDRYRREYEWLKAAYADLDAMGRNFAVQAPHVDLVDTVMSTIAKANHSHEIVSIDAKRTRRRNQRRMWMGLAAAAALLVLAGYILLRGSVMPGRPNAGAPHIANQDQPVHGPVAPKIASDETKLAQERADFMKAWKQLQEKAIQAPGRPSDMETTQPPELETPSMDDIIATRREASGGGQAVSKLLQWASLKKEQALKLAADPDVPPQAVVGAGESLTGNEAAQVLLTVVGRLPEDPHAQFALAKAYTEEPGQQPQALNQVSEVRKLDAENALSYYMEAKLRLEQGDVQGALDALKIAQSLPDVSAYSLESAVSRAQALIASGYPADEAQLVSALTAGMDQYNFLCDLGKNLIQYGQAFMAEKEYGTAQQIFEAVQRLGQQVEEGAQFSQEQLAGMDTQAAAIDMLEQLYTAIESPAGIDLLTTQTQDLVASIEQLGGFFKALDQLFSGSGSSDFFNMISGLILQSGDLTIFDYLQQMGISITGQQ